MFTDNSLRLISASEKAPLSDVTYKMHIPSNEYFILFVKSGRAKVLIGKEVFKIADGSFVVCRGGDSIKYRFSKGCFSEIFCVSFEGDAGCLLAGGVYKCLSAEAAHSAFASLTEEFILKNPLCEIKLPAMLINLLVTLSRSIHEETEVSAVTDELVKDIHKNYLSGKIDVSKYADRVNLSKDRLSVIFRKRFGLAPYKYQLMLKMNDATELLLHTDLSVGEISEKLGFSNQLYFSSAYKKQLGITPSDMRKRK